MALNEAQQLDLAKILDSDLFKKATEEVLLMSEGPVYGLLAPEQAMALAVQKGTRDAFRLLRKLTQPRIVNATPQTPKLKRTKIEP